MKHEVFTNELHMVRDENIRSLVKDCLNQAPDYFYKIPASSTGKYHPAYSLGEGGLVRHTKAAVRIAYDLLQLEQNRQLPHDEIIVALILHDSVKHGFEYSKYVQAEHPKHAAELLIKMASNQTGNNVMKVFTIRNLILTHMGEWNKCYKTKREVLPKPVSVAQEFVHMCDYLASRKHITVEL